MVYAWPKPKMQKFEVRKPEPNRFCNYIDGRTGERCFAETKAGATYCKDCNDRLAVQPSGSKYPSARSIFPTR